MRCVEIKRSVDPADIEQISKLLASVERTDGHRPLSDHLWLDLVHGGRAGFVGLVAWEPGHDHPVAYAQVSRGNVSGERPSFALELVVEPHHRDELGDIGPDLVRSAIDVIADDGGGHVHWWVFQPTELHERLAASVGLAPGRRLVQMRRSLPTGIATTITTRPFEVGRDEEAWLHVNNRAFRHHHEQGGWDLATLRQREGEPWFEPEGFLLHETSGRLDGFCWTKRHLDTDPLVGEIYVIAVDPDAHGRGLGRELTLAGLESLSARGAEIGMLYVDGDNTPAVHLYEQLGFTPHRTDQAFVGDIAPPSADPSPGAP
ncbi:MAG: mycothiol synthase [Ilumatobacteraceae bacterium]|nr:mycothiol synthase [Ilumatobacteraceae bacterium]